MPLSVQRIRRPHVFQHLSETCGVSPSRLGLFEAVNTQTIVFIGVKSLAVLRVLRIYAGPVSYFLLEVISLLLIMDFTHRLSAEG